jgi:metal-sulfur cluster biosynthetic enzyme
MSLTESNKTEWSVHTTHPELIELLLESFRKVIDPEIGLNIIELGLVREVVINEDSAEVTMMMTTPFCPYAPALLESTRRQAEEATQLPTTIEMSMEPWDPSLMEESAARDWGFF